MGDPAPLAPEQPDAWANVVERSFEHAHERAAKSVLRAKRHRTAKRLRDLRGLQRSALDLLTRKYELHDQTRAERDALLARVAALEAETSPHVLPPIGFTTTWFEQSLIDAVDFWRDQARFWRRLFWALVPLNVAAFVVIVMLLVGERQ